MGYFDKCDGKYDWMAYIRIGMYFVAKNGQRRNFCDIHLGGTPGGGELLKSGVYSGPQDSANQITRHERSVAAKNRYFLEGWVHESLDLSAGGVAKLLNNRDRKTFDAWLLGPLLFEGAAYGSVVAALTGFPDVIKHTYESKIDYSLSEKEVDEQRSDPKRHRFKLVVPRGFGTKYLPCTMWGSDYSEGTRPKSADRAVSTPPPLNKALGDARHRLKAAILPKDVIKVVWKVEDFKDELTQCEVYSRGG